MEANNGSHRHNAIWIMGDMVANYAANFMVGIICVSVFELAFCSGALIMVSQKEQINGK